ncbi:MAG: histidine phosphotransferase family protein [Paracoccaceae bacterium]
MPRSEARIGALLALCADAALPVGGQVTLDYRGEAWAARAEGRRLRDDLPWRLLTDAAAGDVAPARIQFALLAEATQAKGRKCAALLGDGVVTIEA